MSDIVFDGMVFGRLREMGDQSQRIAELESEIARLRHTDAEREAIEWAGGNDWWTERNTPTGERHAATLRGLLERTKETK